MEARLVEDTSHAIAQVIRIVDEITVTERHGQQKAVFMGLAGSERVAVVRTWQRWLGSLQMDEWL